MKIKRVTGERVKILEAKASEFHTHWLQLVIVNEYHPGMGGVSISAEAFSLDREEVLELYNSLEKWLHETATAEENEND